MFQIIIGVALAFFTIIAAIPAISDLEERRYGTGALWVFISIVLATGAIMFLFG